MIILFNIKIGARQFGCFGRKGMLKLRRELSSETYGEWPPRLNCIANHAILS